MPRHDRIHPLRDAARKLHDLAVAAGRSRPAAESAGVRDDDHGIRAPASQRTGACVHDRTGSTNRRSVTFTAIVVRAVPR